MATKVKTWITLSTFYYVFDKYTKLKKSKKSHSLDSENVGSVLSNNG